MKREQETFPYIAHLLNGAEVEWKPLGEVAKIEKGKRVTKQQLSSDKEYPVYSGGVKPMGYYDEYNQEADTITIVKYGTAGYVNFITEKFWANDVCYCIKPKADLDNKFLLYVLKNMQEYISSLATDAIPAHLPSPSLEAIQIPVPPLSVQHEIVRILDKFTQLEAELDCRKRQYEYYRDMLLTFNEVVGEDKTLIFSDLQWKTLGEVGTFVRGNGLQKKDLIASGVPAIHYGQIYTYYGVSTEQTISFVSPETAEKLKKVDYGDVIITNTSENLEDVGKAVAYYVKEQGVTGGHATIFKPSEKIIGKYLVYYTQTIEFSNQKRKYAKGTKVIDVSANDLAKITIPLPPIEEQERIAGILDKFDTLVNSISEGLPREIELRRKQYEYYREKLLSFPKN